MDEQSVREHAQAHCDALLAGDIGLASQEMSRELQSNLGSVVSMLPLPLTEATVESVEMTAKAYRAVLHLVGDGGSIRLETRWKERDGRPTMVEASHVPETPAAPEFEPEEPEAG
ncbi:MAG: hypothetical protein ABJC24_03385 [Chloroflexota bacterium]